MQTSIPDSRSKPESEARFTHRLEAFSDLVFGFSLSLLATRLDIPAKVSDVFKPAHWATFIVTFGIICVLWLAHYRIFRHRFIARMPDVIVNFVFLFGIAILPYTVQTFLRFGTGDATLLYFGDFGLVFAALAALRFRGLLQRRGDPDVDVRLNEWRATVRQFIIVLVILGSLVAMNAGLIPKEKFFTIVPATLILITLGTRFAVNRLPGFLQ
ncbi:MAG TPA: TMEM175 family protein [Chthoniobacterales bacterium]|nr:TMEM175 family protein [Chthoniobacterales bacterium]